MRPITFIKTMEISYFKLIFLMILIIISKNSLKIYICILDLIFWNVLKLTLLDNCKHRVFQWMHWWCGTQVLRVLYFSFCILGKEKFFVKIEYCPRTKWEYLMCVKLCGICSFLQGYISFHNFVSTHWHVGINANSF